MLMAAPLGSPVYLQMYKPIGGGFFLTIQMNRIS